MPKEHWPLCSLSLLNWQGILSSFKTVTSKIVNGITVTFLWVFWHYFFSLRYSNKTFVQPNVTFCSDSLKARSYFDESCTRKMDFRDLWRISSVFSSYWRQTPFINLERRKLQLRMCVIQPRDSLNSASQLLVTLLTNQEAFLSLRLLCFLCNLQCDQVVLKNCQITANGFTLRNIYST